MYPVDLLSVEDRDLTSASEKYLTSLESRPGDKEWFQSSPTSKVTITTDNISQLQLFDDDQPECTLLALHPSDDPTQVMALFLHEKWWLVDDVLRTSSKSRSGLQSVQSVVERVLVFLLSQVVERPLQEEVQFSLHPRTESCKLLWIEGEAVGFYTIKHKGSLCDRWSSRCYQLTVLDTVLVRRRWRRRGLGLRMLEDFCSSFSTEDMLGVSSPLSASMVAVCRRFLQLHKEHRDVLYEVEAPGGWAQRRNIWVNIQLGRYSHSIKDRRLTSGVTNEGDDSSQHIQTHEADHARDTNNHVVTSEQQFKLCDQSQEGSSPSARFSETGCSPAAHADDPHTRPPTTTPVKSQNTKQALKPKAHVSADRGWEKPEAKETNRGAKRVRTTENTQ